jgi:hypothetical protein
VPAREMLRLPKKMGLQRAAAIFYFPFAHHPEVRTTLPSDHRENAPRMAMRTEAHRISGGRFRRELNKRTLWGEGRRPALARYPSAMDGKFLMVLPTYPRANF